MTALDQRLAQVAEAVLVGLRTGWRDENYSAASVAAAVAQALVPLLTQWQAEDRAEAEAERDELARAIKITGKFGESAKAVDAALKNRDWAVVHGQEYLTRAEAAEQQLADAQEQIRAHAEERDAALEQLADLRAGIEALAFSEDAHAVLFGVIGTHPESYGGVTKDEALERAGELLTRLRALLAGETNE